MMGKTTSKFKVGDKVRIVNFHDEEVIGKTGIIIGVEDAWSEYNYYMKWDTIPFPYNETIPLYKNEIEPAVKVGEQLLFDFMIG